MFNRIQVARVFTFELEMHSASSAVTLFADEGFSDVARRFYKSAFHLNHSSKSWSLGSSFLICAFQAADEGD
jgi:hypothetical protein